MLRNACYTKIQQEGCTVPWNKRQGGTAMFKKKPPEGSGSPQAAAPGGKAGFLRRRWPLLVIAGAAIVGGAVWMTQVRATQAPAEAAYIETKPTRRSITNIYSEDGTVEAA